MLVSERDLRALLSRYEFTPQVYFGQDVVEIWLPELGVWSRGDHFTDARDDLLDEIDQLLFLLEADGGRRRRTSSAGRAGRVTTGAM